MKFRSASPFAEVVSGFLVLAMIFLVLLVVWVLGSAIWLQIYAPLQHYDVVYSSVVIHPQQAGMTFLNGDDFRYRPIVGELSIAVKKGEKGRAMLSALSKAAMLGLLFWAVWTTRKIVGTMVRNEPFSESNPARFRWIGILLIAIQLIQSGMRFADTFWLKHHPTLKGVEAQYDLHISWIVVFAGFLLILLAEVFRRGLALQRDQELTV